MNADVTFLTSNVDVASPARCVDGRVDSKSRLGPQMLGGSLHPVLLSALCLSEDFSPEKITRCFKKLQSSEHVLGVHRGSHKDPGKNISDCGFADRMTDILAVAIENRQEVTQRILEIYKDNVSIFPEFSTSFETLLSQAYDKIEKYSPSQVTLHGEELVDFAISCGANVEDVEAEHAEKIAYVNLGPDTTFDTKKANNEGWQAFNLDMWSCIKQSETLGVDAHFALFASLILYAATEVVLVEQKGKEPLPIGIHIA